MIKLHTGDVLKCLAKLPDESVQCVVTSPPYWGLRDYQTGTWKGGDPDCDHKRSVAFAPDLSSTLGNGRSRANQNHAQEPYRDRCGKCGARRIDDQIGLEPTPEAFVAKMVAVFAEVRRVLRDDGTCWVNLGDTYVANGSNHVPQTKAHIGSGHAGPNRDGMTGLKPKDLVGIPWRVAFALQADGWYLRSDIIWHKPNPMPESVRDRPTKSHEYVFLLTKRSRYYYDADAVREEAKYGRCGWDSQQFKNHDITRHHGGPGSHENGNDPSAGRNLRTVWTITPKPFKGAHFATFAPQLVERCVKAGTSERGACPTCGAPWERVTERGAFHQMGRLPVKYVARQMGHQAANRHHDGHVPGIFEVITLGWRPTCSCVPAEPVPCVVLDPFAGAGTVGLVCQQLGRDHIGIDLNRKYVTMARKRIAAAQPQPDQVPAA